MFIPKEVLDFSYLPLFPFQYRFSIIGFLMTNFIFWLCCYLVSNLLSWYVHDFIPLFCFYLLLFSKAETFPVYIQFLQLLCLSSHLTFWCRHRYKCFKHTYWACGSFSSVFHVFRKEVWLCNMSWVQLACGLFAATFTFLSLLCLEELSILDYYCEEGSNRSDWVYGILLSKLVDWFCK